MMNKMIVGNLAHRPVRSLISIVAVALEVTLILLIVGLSLGMVNDSKGRQAGIGADVLVMPPGSSYIVGLTGAPMPIKIGDVLAKLPHVVAVAPVITQVSTNGTLEELRISGPISLYSGGTIPRARRRHH
jgi:putative ABC transport system permease protein